MSEKRKKVSRPLKGWGGFVDGRLHCPTVDTGHGGFGIGLVVMPAIFGTQSTARKQYQDIRRVEIREVKKP